MAGIDSKWKTFFEELEYQAGSFIIFSSMRSRRTAGIITGCVAYYNNTHLQNHHAAVDPMEQFPKNPFVTHRPDTLSLELFVDAYLAWLEENNSG